MVTAVFTKYASNKTIKHYQQPAQNFQHPTTFTSKDSLANVYLIENKFGSLEECIVSVKTKITEQCEEVIGIIRNTNKTAKSALDLAMSNSALISENTKKISSHEFDYQTLLERLKSLQTEKKKLKEELEESKNRSMRKLLIFQNIQQDHKKES